MNEYKIISKSYYTLQTIEDVAMYDAQIISSVGDIITPGTLNTKLKVTVYHNLIDVTNKFTKIVWKKFSYNGVEPIEEKGWGDDKLGQREILISRNEYKSKVRIECHIYGELNGQEQIVAGAYITLVDVNDLNPSNTEPLNPKEGEVWLDTSVEPPIFKVYKDGSWQIIGDLNPIYEDIYKLIEDIKKIDDEILDINQELGNATLLTIDNKKDYLFEYETSLSSTNDVQPNRGYKADLKNNGYFNSKCLSVSSVQNISYKNIIDVNNNFVINMWIRPHETIGTNNEKYKLLSLGPIKSSLLNIYNSSPVITSTANKRFVVEFGNDDLNIRQYLDLVHNTSFNTNTFEMFTILFLKDAKEFKFFRNGQFWSSKTLSKVNTPIEFTISNAGWDIDNLVVLNNKTYDLNTIKEMYELNKPYRDLTPNILLAPIPEQISMTIE